MKCWLLRGSGFPPSCEFGFSFESHPADCAFDKRLHIAAQKARDERALDDAVGAQFVGPGKLAASVCLRAPILPASRIDDVGAG